MEIIGQRVLHKKLGCGVIISCSGKPQNSNKYIIVEFESKSIELQFPDSFDKHLEAVDEGFKKYVSDQLAEKAVIKVDNNEKIKMPRPINIESSTKFGKQRTCLTLGNICGTNSKTIYLDCCADFGWDKSQSNNFGKQGALLYAKSATSEGFSPWFVSHHELTQTTGGSWNNIIDGDFIYEKWDEPKLGLFEDKTTRVVFIKLGSDYRFYGVFCVDNIEKDEHYKYIKTYRRISKKYPI